jgi:hypothetical protein
MSTIIATPFGPDGDFIEKDIQQMRKAKAVAPLAVPSRSAMTKSVQR